MAFIDVLNECVGKGLDKSMSHFMIVELWARTTGDGSQNPDLRNAYMKQIEKAVIDDELKAIVEESVSGYDDGWREISDENRIRKIEDGWLNRTFVQYIINRDDFRAWLKKSNQWPVADDCLLAKWFEDEQQAEAGGDAGTGSHATTEPASAKVIQSDSNELNLSGLLNIPKKIDGWFQVIDDMTRDFYNQHKKIPNETQAWGLLWTNPPVGYAITTNKDKGKEDCLVMPGVNQLSKSAFSKRWENYTANKAQ